MLNEGPRGMGDTHKIRLADEGSGPDSHMDWRPLSDFHEYLPARYRNATPEQKATGHWGGDFFIVQDFVNAITKGVKPAIDVYEACEWTAVGILSELSVMNEGRAMDMPRFRKNRINSENRN